MEEETVEPQETPQPEETNEQVAQEETQETETTEEAQENRVPLSALQKERKKRQELELQLKWERERLEQQNSPQQQVDDDSKYESATREDLTRSQEEVVRMVEERNWIKSNPEKYEKVNELLPQFLKQRPNLVHAINGSTNRYEEAYILMEALTPKQQKSLEKAAAPSKEAPKSPASVPKAASLGQTVDIMNMSDSEFNEWRKGQRKR